MAGLCILMPFIINKFKNMIDSSPANSLNIELLNFSYIKINFIFYQVFAATQLYKSERVKKYFLL